MNLKKSENYILSICIPTFNRVNSLKKLLEQLLTLKDYKGIEYCISNNCSTDGTEALIHKYQELMKIKYERQNTNIGSSYNIKHVISMATGKFILTIGDDDLIHLDDFKVIYKKLQLTEGNSWIYLSKDMGKDFKFNSINFKYFLIKKTLKKVGFMGSHIIPKKIIYKINLETQLYFGWPHIAILLRYLNMKNARFEIWQECLVNQAGGDKSYYWTPEEFLEILIIRHALLRKYSIKIFDFYWLMLYREIYNIYFIGTILYVRLFGFSNLSKSNKYLIKNLFYKWYELPFIIPVCIFNIFIYVVPSVVYKFIIPDSIYLKMLYLSSKLNNKTEYSASKRGL